MPRLAVPFVVAAAIVFLTVPRAIEDWQFQLAGLADPFLGRPAPGVTIVIGALISIVVLLVALGRSRPRRRAIRSPLIWPLIAFWGAYAVGAGATVVGGGQSTYSGTLAYDFGPVIGHQTTVRARCRTPVGKPSVLSDVAASTDDVAAPVGGLPMLWLRHEATGGRARPGQLAEPLVGGRDGRPLPPYAVPRMTDRPRPYLDVTMGDGTHYTEPPIDFLRAYDYRISAIEDRGLSGSATLHAQRTTNPYDPGGGLRWVDLVIANDPWPPTFEMSVRWTCTAAAPA